MVDNVQLDNIGFADSGKPSYEEGYGQQIRNFSSLIGALGEKKKEDKTPLADLVGDISIIADAKANGDLNNQRARLEANKKVREFVSKHKDLAQEAMSILNASFGETGMVGGVRSEDEVIEEAKREAQTKQFQAAFSALSPTEQKLVGSPNSPEVTKKFLRLTSASARVEESKIFIDELKTRTELDTQKKASIEEELLNSSLVDYLEVFTSDINSTISTIVNNASPSEFAKTPGDILAYAGEKIRYSAIKAKQELSLTYGTLHRTGKLTPLLEQIDDMSNKALDLLSKRSDESIKSWEDSIQLNKAITNQGLWSDPNIAKVLATFQALNGVDLTGTELGKILNASLPKFVKGLEAYYKNMPMDSAIEITPEAAQDISKVVNNSDNLRDHPKEVEGLTATLIESLNNPNVSTKVYDETLSTLSANQEVALRVLSPEKSGLSETAREKLTLYYKALGESLGNTLYTELSTRIEEPLPSNTIPEAIVSFLAPFGFANAPADLSVLPESVKAIQVVDIRVTDSTFKFSPKKGFEKYPEVVKIADRLNRNYSKRLQDFTRTYTHLEQASGKNISYREGFDSILSGEESFSFVHKPKKEAFNLPEVKEVVKEEEVKKEGEDLSVKVKELNDKVEALSQTPKLEPGTIVQTDDGKLKIVDKETKELRSLTKEERDLILEGSE